MFCIISKSLFHYLPHTDWYANYACVIIVKANHFICLKIVWEFLVKTGSSWVEFRNSYIDNINVLFAWFCIQSRVKQHLTLIFFWKLNIEVSYLSRLENILSYNSVTETSCSRMWRQRIRVISISLRSYQSDISKLSHLL